MGKAKKAIFIDVVNETITEVEIGDWKEIAPKIGCDLFECVDVNRKGDTLYVDEEGLMTLTAESKFFWWKGMSQPFAGSGLLMKTNLRSGAGEGTKWTVEQVKEHVTFMTMDEVRDECGA